jgi:bacteriorhodopsin
MLADLYRWLYYPLAALVVCGTFADLTPRAKKSTRGEGVEKAWFYVAIWTAVPAQVVIWAVWRLGGQMGLSPFSLAWARLASFIAVTGLFLWLGFTERLPRTARYYEGPASSE